ncbi:MAG: aminoacyl-tRNA hydrolase [Deltaproteobacteria bacterium]
MANPTETFLIVGLGNPGPKYEKTRHNIGFEIVDYLAKSWGDNSFSPKFQGLFCQINQSGIKVLLLKPETYMNLSGRSVREALQFFKLNPSSQLLVVNDDLDLPPAQLRLRLSGGTGGHNGLKSIVECLGTENFARLRVGIGRSEKVPTENYVLGKIPKSEQSAFDDAIQRSKEGIESILKDGLQKAMNVINVKRGPDES